MQVQCFMNSFTGPLTEKLPAKHSQRFSVFCLKDLLFYYPNLY